jgi:antirestriction protein
MKTTIEISNAAVYCGTYAKYNNGNLFGEWLKFSDYSDADSFLEACKELHSDEENPEFMFQDYENFPENFYSESMGENDISEIYEYIETVESSGYGYEVFEAAAACDIQLCDVEEAYSGEFDSDEDFAQNMADELGYTNKEVSWPYTCIDWTYAARELMYDYCSHNGHYFRNL